MKSPLCYCGIRFLNTFHMTLSKEGSRFSDTQKFETPVLKKKLKVVNKPYKDTYVVGLHIQGKYLGKYGFELGDILDVIISENRILIEKVINK